MPYWCDACGSPTTMDTGDPPRCPKCGGGVEWREEEEGKEIIRRALEQARHELTTLHGLHVCDSYGEARREQGATHLASQCFLETMWQIDTKPSIELIDQALATHAEEEEC